MGYRPSWPQHPPIRRTGFFQPAIRTRTRFRQRQSACTATVRPYCFRMNDHRVNPCRRQAIEAELQRRPGEQKLGEHLRFPDPNDWAAGLNRLFHEGVRYALVGIPESVGPMANFGRCCSEYAWQAFLHAFCNLQHNQFLYGESIVCLGAVDTASINAEAAALNRQHPDRIDRLRQLCDELDHRVAPVLATVYEAGITPIVVGGGHNNAYPLIQTAARSLQGAQGIGCINFDPHADLRPPEGRHSGNSFHYALQEGVLHRYFVLGLQEVYTPQSMLDFIAAHEQIGFSRFDPSENPAERVDDILAFFDDPDLPLGLDIDLDAIAGMPSSAMTPSGYTLDQTRAFLRTLASRRRLRYLHLPEGAPARDNPTQMRQVGKSLAYLVSDFIHFQENDPI